MICSDYVFPQNSFQYYTDNKGRVRDSSTLIVFAKFLRNSILGKLFPKFFEYLKKRRLQNLLIIGKKQLLEELNALGLHNIPIQHVEHHLCHSRAVYHSFMNKSILGNSLIFTLDGAGDNTCSSVTYVNEKGEWNKLAETPLKSSLGYIYSATTKFLGMKVLEHEYKVMGWQLIQKKIILKVI